MSSIAAECAAVFLLAAFTLLLTPERPAVVAFLALFEKEIAEVVVQDREAFVLFTISFNMLFMA